MDRVATFESGLDTLHRELHLGQHVERRNGMVELTIELYETPAGSKTLDDFTQGFPYIVSGLKSLVETGKALPPPY